MNRTKMARLAPNTLTGRLVATLVTVVVVSSALIAVVTTLAMRSYLNDRLDQQVGDTLDRAAGGSIRIQPGFLGAPDDDSDPPPIRGGRGQGEGTLNAFYVGSAARGFVVTSSLKHQELSSTVLRSLAKLPRNGESRVMTLPALGQYRLKATKTPDGLVVVAGLSTREVGGIIAKLIRWELLLALVAVAVAATVGRIVVRRQLRPLREVAATAHEVADLPLASGEIEMSVRVPDELTDPRTEVGQVGSAMNTMLGHVEAALGARHRSEQQVRQFVADASHELRTPLSTIHGYAELSRRTKPADVEQLTQAMSKVESEATRMSALVDDLLLLARLDSGRPLERAEVDATRLVLEAVGDAKVIAPDHRWQLNLPDEPIMVTGDEQRLHQAVTNLLNNARRHTPPGTTVTVSASTDDAGTTLSVHDNGPGLSPDLVARAFERFTRGDSSRTRVSGGAGLGLSLVQAITAAHSGAVDVRSEPGDTEFRIHLPAIHR